MLKKLLVVGIGLAGFQGYAQEMFSNGGFESYSSCPNGWDQTSKIIGCSGSNDTPDYYNCSYGSSKAYKGTGSVYLGAIKDPSNSQNVQEGINLLMDTPLTQGEDYFVSIQNNYGTTVYGDPGFDYAAIRGCYKLKFVFGLSNESGNPSNFQFEIDGDADVGSANNSYNSYSFTFNAKKNYTHLYIVTAATTKTDGNHSDCISSGALAYIFYNIIDDLSIQPVSAMSMQTEETTITNAKRDLVQVSQMPHDVVLFNESEDQKEIEVYDLMGRRILDFELKMQEEVHLSDEMIGSGIFIIRYELDGELIMKRIKL